MSAYMTGSNILKMFPNNKGLYKDIIDRTKQGLRP